MHRKIKALFSRTYSTYSQGLYFKHLSRTEFALNTLSKIPNAEDEERLRTLYNDHLVRDSATGWSIWIGDMAAMKMWLESVLEAFELHKLEPALSAQIVSRILHPYTHDYKVWVGSVSDVFEGNHCIPVHVWLTLFEGALVVDYHMSDLLDDPYIPQGIFLPWQAMRVTYHPEVAVNYPIFSDEELAEFVTPVTS